MPYIPQERAKALAAIADELPQNSGELNFVLTRTALDYLESKGLSYQSCNDIMGAFEGAKQEFYRRVVAPYEERKIRENGDLFP